MSGHNKWSQIKRQKEKTDGQKSKVFGKFAKLIGQAAKKAKGNMKDPSLLAAIEKAKSFNMPNENIERAMKKAATDKSADLETITYEAYGPGGCALMIDVLTDNKNKAAAEVKHILALHNLALASMGSAAWAFQKSQTEGWIPQTMTPISEEDSVGLEKIMAELEENDEVQDVYTNAE